MVDAKNIFLQKFPVHSTDRRLQYRPATTPRRVIFSPIHSSPIHINTQKPSLQPQIFSISTLLLPHPNSSMGDTSSGALVPTVKSEDRPPPLPPPPAVSSSGMTETAAEEATAAAEEAEIGKDLLCPICMGTIKDAFLTACGHSFCYMCIVTHLQNKSDCPCCSHYLTKSLLYPNFLLNKVGILSSAIVMCIVIHLWNMNDCPCCSRYLTKNLLYLKFLLDKVGILLFPCLLD